MLFISIHSLLNPIVSISMLNWMEGVVHKGQFIWYTSKTGLKHDSFVTDDLLVLNPLPEKVYYKINWNLLKSPIADASQARILMNEPKPTYMMYAWVILNWLCSKIWFIFSCTFSYLWHTTTKQTKLLYSL